MRCHVHSSYLITMFVVIVVIITMTMNVGVYSLTILPTRSTRVRIYNHYYSSNLMTGTRANLPPLSNKYIYYSLHHSTNYYDRPHQQQLRLLAFSSRSCSSSSSIISSSIICSSSSSSSWRNSPRKYRSEVYMATGGNGNSSNTNNPRRQREEEIRRKINELKREKKNVTDDGTKNRGTNNALTPSPSSTIAETYADKIQTKLGKNRRGRQIIGQMFGGSRDGISRMSYNIANKVADDTTNINSQRRTLDMNINDDDDDDDDNDDLEETTRWDNKKKDSTEDYSLVDVLRYYETNEEDGENADYGDEEYDDDITVASEAASEAIELLRRNVLRNNDFDTTKDEMDEEDMINAVAKALAEKEEEEEDWKTNQMDEGYSWRSTSTVTEESTSNTKLDGKPISTTSYLVEDTMELKLDSTTTSGVGGSWSPPPASSSSTSQSPSVDEYQPKVGTWGAFPRPRNISVAYGGGKRVGAGVKTDEKQKQQSLDSTKERLRAYREKMGIEVQSEKDYADVIEEALLLASRAMQRGSYGAGVSALEKVTQYCSTRSKLGGKVFLELAMAYEAEGKTDQAIGLYSTLTKSPIEEIKMNADKLLYGLEAINFMRNKAKLEDFSRKKAADTFIDATGFRDITKNFDKVYNTAYIDLNKGSQYYRLLTENVVRSTREARQILLKAVSASEVDRMKVVQALRSISRHFDDALLLEKKAEEAKNVPVDYAGRPIVSTPPSSASIENDLASAIGVDGFVLSEPIQMLNKMNGEWRLQLMADKKGDGVDFFNTTLFWQKIDSTSCNDLVYTSRSGGMKASFQSGTLDFNYEERILFRDGVSSTSGVVVGSGGGSGLLSILFGGAGGSAAATASQMIKVPQQILSVDSALLVTRAIVKVNAIDNVKDYYSVWRRVEPGTYADLN